MNKGTLTRTGSIITALLIAALPLPGATPTLQTRLDRTAIPEGESTVLRITVPASSSSIKPLGYPSVPGLDISYAGMHRNFQFINGKTVNETQLLFNVTAGEPGKFTIPSFVFQSGQDRFSSRPVTLTVFGHGEGAAPGRTGGGTVLRAVVELSSRKAVTGEPLVMRYYLLTQGAPVSVEGFQVPPDTRGFAVKKVDETIAPAAEGEFEKNHLATFILVPAAPGPFKVGGGTAVIAMEDQGDDFSGFPMPRFVKKRKLLFETVAVDISLPPAAGKPADYRGDVGDFTLSVKTPKADARVFAEKKLTVTVSGTGNLLTMAKPAVAETQGIRLLTEEGEGTVEVAGKTVKGEKKFIITLIPEKAGTYEAGAVTFCFFNPRTGKYVTLNTRPFRFEAKGDGKAARKDSFDGEEGDRPELNLLYIALIVLIVAGAVVFVVLWERRRYAAALQAEASPDPEEQKSPIEKSVLLADLDRAHSSGDAQSFLRVADRMISIIEKGGAADSEFPDRNARLSEVKERVYGYRYGGTRPDEEGLKEIRDCLAGLCR